MGLLRVSLLPLNVSVRLLRLSGDTAVNRLGDVVRRLENAETFLTSGVLYHDLFPGRVHVRVASVSCAVRGDDFSLSQSVFGVESVLELPIVVLGLFVRDDLRRHFLGLVIVIRGRRLGGVVSASATLEERPGVLQVLPQAGAD